MATSTNRYNVCTNRGNRRVWYDATFITGGNAAVIEIRPAAAA